MKGPNERSPAEELLVRFLADCVEEEERRFRELCAQWPEEAPELERLRAELRCIDRLISAEALRWRRTPPWMRRRP